MGLFNENFYTCPEKMDLLTQDTQLPVLAGEREECLLGARFRVALLQGLVQKNNVERLKAKINKG